LPTRLFAEIDPPFRILRLFAEILIEPAGPKLFDIGRPGMEVIV
jgi:hypothetical protein